MDNDTFRPTTRGITDDSGSQSEAPPPDPLRFARGVFIVRKVQPSVPLST